MPFETANPTRTVVLVGPLIAASDGAVLDLLASWASSRGFAVHVLPAPGHWAHPEADAAHRRRLARADRAELVRVFDALRSSLGPDASPVPLVIAADEVAGQAGRAWFQRVREAAETTRLPLQRAVRIPLDEPLDFEHLEAFILERS